MYLTQIPFYPANRAIYDFEAVGADARDRLPALPGAVPLRGLQRLHQDLPDGRGGDGLRRRRSSAATSRRPPRSPSTASSAACAPAAAWARWRSTTSPSWRAGSTAASSRRRPSTSRRWSRRIDAGNVRPSRSRKLKAMEREELKKALHRARDGAAHGRRGLAAERHLRTCSAEEETMPYTPELKELIKSVEKTRAERVERKKRGEEVPFLDLDERKERLRVPPRLQGRGPARAPGRARARATPSPTRSPTCSRPRAASTRTRSTCRARRLRDRRAGHRRRRRRHLGGAPGRRSRGAKVILATKLRHGDANTMMAEGGIQAATKGEKDSPYYHYLDVMGGGHFTNVPELVETLVTDAPDAIRWLEDLGVNFTKYADGRLQTDPRRRHLAASACTTPPTSPAPRSCARSATRRATAPTTSRSSSSRRRSS